MAGETTRRQISYPQWSEVRGHLHMRLNDAAMVLNTTVTYLSLCRQNGLSHWPGKKIRSLKAMGIKFTLETDAPGSSAPAAFGCQAKVVVTMNKADDDMIRMHSPVITNDPPGELITLNLIDKVGLQSSSSE